MMLPGYAPVTARVVQDLQGILGNSNVATHKDKREAYSYDEVGRHLWHRPYLAEVVVFPENTRHVQALMEYAKEERIPVTPRGAGTGLSGGAVPEHGGIVLSTEKLNRILEIDTSSLTATVEPGVITAEINRAAAKEGLFYPGDPCSGDVSSIGGNVAENAGGNKVIKYGATGANVLGMEVVLPDGSVTRFGGKGRKDVTGLDFVHLMVGSEGILGIITKIILKLVPLPGNVVDLLVPFPTSREAIAFVPHMMTRAKIIPSSLEFMERRALNLAERYLGTFLPYSDAGAHLIIQLEGKNETLLADHYEEVGDLCLRRGALEVFVGDNRRTQERLWKARKAIPEAVMAFYSCYTKEDVVVPPGDIPKLVDTIHGIIQERSLESATFGHAGDGNLHVNLMVPAGESPREEELQEARLDLYKAVRALGGTLSGEHGIGLKRRDYLHHFLDNAQIELIRRVKTAFDPYHILNPGKIVELFPSENQELGIIQRAAMQKDIIDIKPTEVPTNHDSSSRTT